MPAGGMGGNTAGTGGNTAGSGGTAGTGGTGGSAPRPDGGTGGTAGMGGMGGGMNQDYFPLVEKHCWTYQVMEQGVQPYMKRQCVEAFEKVGGVGPHKDKMAWRMKTTKVSGGLPDQTVSWQAWEGNRLVRYREQAFPAGNTMRVSAEDHWDPPRLRFDALPMGKELSTKPSWTETFKEITQDFGKMPPMQLCTAANMNCMKTEMWAVDAVPDKVMLKIGGMDKSFDAVRVRKMGGAESDKTYWFVKGVGKVRETGKLQSETLIDYSFK
jgi:hypothetical protein